MSLGYQSVELDRTAPELAVFFLLSLGSVIFLLENVDGKFLHIQEFLMARRLHFVTSERLILHLTSFLKVLSWLYIFLPFLILLFWSFSLLYYAV